VAEEEFDGRRCTVKTEILEVLKVDCFEWGPIDCFGESTSPQNQGAEEFAHGVLHWFT
jgi:hypothetical protein